MVSRINPDWVTTKPKSHRCWSYRLAAQAGGQGYVCAVWAFFVGPWAMKARRPIESLSLPLEKFLLLETSAFWKPVREGYINMNKLRKWTTVSESRIRQI